jgi:hypothetical protein
MNIICVPNMILNLPFQNLAHQNHTVSNLSSDQTISHLQTQCAHFESQTYAFRLDLTVCYLSSDQTVFHLLSDQ